MTIAQLVRVTVVAPGRRIDLALPEHASVAEIMPGLLARSGERLADQGVSDGGWMLRRTDGEKLTLGRTLGAHRIRDGEILHLVPSRTEWPELQYDDLVDAVAGGATRTGAVWNDGHTRLAGLAMGGAAVALGLVAVLRSGPPAHPDGWGGTGGLALLVASVLLGVGVLLSRVAGDSGAGAWLGGLSLPYAVAGGGLLLAGDRPVTALGAPHLLTASAALLLFGILGLVGVVDHASWFVAAMSTGALGVVAGWLATTDALDAAEVAALVSGVLLICTPAFAPLSLRLGRVPTPLLPRTTADLVRDDPQPARHVVYGTVVRADALLTGMLAASCLVTAIASTVLAAAGTKVASGFVALLAVGALLRLRSYQSVKQRVLLFGAGAVAAGALVVGRLVAGWHSPIVLAVPVLLAAAAFAVLCGLRYSTRPPSPYLGRYAELLEVAVILATVPMMSWVLGLFGLVRGWAG